jgi:hypothetical protein
LTLLACIGNSARVISGDSKGAIGYVTGKHGGIEHILVHFPLETLENLAIGDKIQIKACGLGMELLDFPLIKVMNIDPHLLNRIEIRQKGGKLQLPVTHIIPGKIMGSGLGKDNTYIGDYDIQMFDEGIVREYNLDTIRFGDMVLITDVDHTWGRIYREGAVTVGVVIHSACIQAGHGPGVTTIMTSKEGLIEPIMDAEANLKNWMG